VAERGIRADRVVVTTPAFDDDLSVLQRAEDLAVEQLVTQIASPTPIRRSRWIILTSEN
jgi:hypothetical protein